MKNKKLYLFVIVSLIAVCLLSFTACKKVKNDEEKPLFTEGMTKEEIQNVFRTSVKNCAADCVMTKKDDETKIHYAIAENGIALTGDNGDLLANFLENDRYYNIMISHDSEGVEKKYMSIFDVKGYDVIVNNFLDSIIEESFPESEVSVIDGSKVKLTIIEDEGTEYEMITTVTFFDFNKTSLVMPDSIKDYADLPANDTVLKFNDVSGGVALSDCENFIKTLKLSDRYFGDSLVEIQNNAIYRKTQEITIPVSVVKLGYQYDRGEDNPLKVNYLGTKEQWKSIEKDAFWNGEDVKVFCSDGEYTK